MAEQDSRIEMLMTFFTSIIALAKPWGLETQPILDGAEGIEATCIKCQIYVFYLQELTAISSLTVSDIDQLSRLLAAQLATALRIQTSY